MNLPPDAQFLVFTDLDGTLLDHHSYSCLDAVPQLHRLEHQGIPVMPVSSKTRTEIVQLRGELGNEHPFIAENGAAVFIGIDYFPQQPADTVARDGFWVREFTEPRATWLELLASLRSDFAGEYDYFYRAGTEGIMRMTGLSRALAIEANSREYSEPVKWLGSDERRSEFIARLAAAGATALQGGRFLSVSGDCSKGRALAWLRDCFADQAPERPVHDLAAGDSANDVDMLEAAATALLVRSPVHDFPTLARTTGVMRTTDYGPAGWSEGVTRWLEGFRVHQ